MGYSNGLAGLSDLSYGGNTRSLFNGIRRQDNIDSSRILELILQHELIVLIWCLALASIKMLMAIK
jgi:hypothetical protein